MYTRSYLATDEVNPKLDFSDRKSVEKMTVADFEKLSLPERNALFEKWPDVYRQLVLGQSGV